MIIENLVHSQLSLNLPCNDTEGAFWAFSRSIFSSAVNGFGFGVGFWIFKGGDFELFMSGRIWAGVGAFFVNCGDDFLAGDPTLLELSGFVGGEGFNGQK